MLLTETTISVISLWSAMNSWLTPTILFLLLNIMIGTIAITSRITAGQYNSFQEDNTQRQQKNNYSSLISSPSAASHFIISRSSTLLHRLKSINFLYRSEHDESTDLEIESSLKQGTEADHQFQNRIRMDENCIALHDDDDEEEERVLENDDDDEYPSMDEIYRRIQEGKVNNNSVFGRSNSDRQQHQEKKKTHHHHQRMEKRSASERRDIQEEEEEVDSKADDFIIKFRQQLEMQRLESLIMSGGAGN